MCKYVELTPMQRMNWVLLAGCLIALLDLVSTVGWYHPGQASMSNRTRVKETQTGHDNLPVIQLADLTKRNVFEPLWKPPPPPRKVVVQQPVAPPVPKVPLSQKAARYRLVGILHEGARQAVIEDQQTSKTLYVTAGQTLEDIEIENVMDDHVTLKSADERMDLSL